MKKKKEGLVTRTLNRILRLKHLKLFELGVSFLKGFNLKVEFFEKRKEK